MLSTLSLSSSRSRSLSLQITKLYWLVYSVDGMYLILNIRNANPRSLHMSFILAMRNAHKDTFRQCSLSKLKLLVQIT